MTRDQPDGLAVIVNIDMPSSIGPSDCCSAKDGSHSTWSDGRRQPCKRDQPGEVSQKGKTPRAKVISRLPANGQWLQVVRTSVLVSRLLKFLGFRALVIP
jgi:hypothetical protein